MAHLVAPHLAVLQALAAGPCWNDGIRERVREATGGAVALSRGNVTPALAALERDGFIAPAGEQPRGDFGGTARKLYRITAAGMVEAARQREALAALLDMADGRRGRCGTPTSAPPSAPGDRYVVKDGDDVEEGDRFEPA
ncbi:PadR family transcriptional regulator [Sorangium sp. So ce388]|uniref:PadR family transcriptional regulator n=1 Tax=Sorangium sp. So ce388 TaxID=3133309 RepID=UPI003F5C6B91